MAAPMAVDVDTQGCRYNYHVTAYKATAVSHCAVGSFTGANDNNLIIARRNHLEISTLTPEGLKGVLQVPIYGSISAMQLLRLKGEAKDLLFMLTEHYHTALLEYDAESKELVTRAGGDVKDNMGRPVDNGQMGVVDPDGRAVALHLYDGVVKIIPLDDRPAHQGEAFNVRVEELNLVDMAWLAGCTSPTLALLYEDAKKSRHVKTYTLSLRQKELSDGPWSQQNLEPGCGLLIPVPSPLGGLIVVGETMVQYLSGGNQPRTTSLPKASVIRAYARIDEDGSRYLLSDWLSGALYLLVLAHAEGRVAGLKITQLGRTSAGSALAYLDNGVVYVGSRGGDSQLIRLHAEPITPAAADEPASYVEVLESWPCLGPCLDLAVMDLDRQGQGQVVAAVGLGGDGSLRVVRNGIGINEQASLELPGIKGVWGLRASWMDAYEQYLVLTFVGETRVLAITPEDELDEISLPGFEAEAQSLMCANTQYDQLVQVTETAVRLMDAGTGALLTSWSPGDGRSINMAAASPTQVLLATGGGWLHLLEGQTAVQGGPPWRLWAAGLLR